MLDLPQEIMVRLATGYLVLLGAVFVWGWLLYGMMARAQAFKLRGEMERTEQIYRE